MRRGTPWGGGEGQSPWASARRLQARAPCEAVERRLSPRIVRLRVNGRCSRYLRAFAFVLSCMSRSARPRMHATARILRGFARFGLTWPFLRGLGETFFDTPGASPECKKPRPILSDGASLARIQCAGYAFMSSMARSSSPMKKKPDVSNI